MAYPHLHSAYTFKPTPTNMHSQQHSIITNALMSVTTTAYTARTHIANDSSAQRCNWIPRHGSLVSEGRVCARRRCSRGPARACRNNFGQALVSKPHLLQEERQFLWRRTMFSAIDLISSCQEEDRGNDRDPQANIFHKSNCHHWP